MKKFSKFIEGKGVKIDKIDTSDYGTAPQQMLSAIKDLKIKATYDEKTQRGTMRIPGFGFINFETASENFYFEFDDDKNPIFIKNNFKETLKALITAGKVLDNNR